jgi:hypothetical protein
MAPCNCVAGSKLYSLSFHCGRWVQTLRVAIFDIICPRLQINAIEPWATLSTRFTSSFTPISAAIWDKSVPIGPYYILTKYTIRHGQVLPLLRATSEAVQRLNEWRTINILFSMPDNMHSHEEMNRPELVLHFAQLATLILAMRTRNLRQSSETDTHQYSDYC